MVQSKDVCVTVRYQSFFREITSKSEEKITVRDAHLKNLLALLIKKYGRRFGVGTIDADTGKKHIGYYVFVNGKFSEPDVILNEGDEITIMGPPAGG